MNFENFYENMFDSLQEKNKEIDFENTNMMSIQNALYKYERLDGLFTASLATYLFIGYFLVEYSPKLAMSFLLALVFLKEFVRKMYLNTLQEYL